MKDYSEPAFPTYGPRENSGMTLRDYFAAKAIGGYLSDTNVRGTFAELAKDAYLMADAMLVERAK